jgi:DNA-binding NtrC family response regulator
MQSYPWPGNVRELKNAMESIVVFHRGDTVEPADLPAEIRAALGVEARPAPPPREGAVAPAEAQGPKTMADIERDAILAALESSGGRRVEAARRLEIGLRTLQRKLKEYKDQGYLEE